MTLLIIVQTCSYLLYSRGEASSPTIPLIVLSLQHCGCVTFYMPRNPTQTPICSPEKLECIKEATDVVDKTAFDVDHVTETNCKCLPACSTYDYPFEISTGKMAKAELMHVDKKSVGEGGKSKHTPYTCF